MVDWVFLGLSLLILWRLLAKHGRRPALEIGATYVTMALALSGLRGGLSLPPDSNLRRATITLELALLAYAVYLSFRVPKASAPGAV
jgi:hypothetical protein